MNYTQHALSAAFPRMTADELQELRDSIASAGVQTPITIFEGQVLDGWNRYQAALDVGMPCPTVQLADTDPVDFVRAQNATRRHMTDAQKAMAITAIYRWRPVGMNQHSGSALSAETPKSAKQLAEIAGVGVRSIGQAKAVQTNAVPEVRSAVQSGEIGLPKAAAIAKMPPAQQAAAIHKPLPKSQPAKREKAQDVAVREVPTSPESECGPDADELAAQEAAERADRLAFQKLLDADDALATSFAEVKRLNAEVSILTLARDGAMRRANEAILLVKKRDRHIAKLIKELAALQREAT